MIFAILALRKFKVGAEHNYIIIHVGKNSDSDSESDETISSMGMRLHQWVTFYHIQQDFQVSIHLALYLLFYQRSCSIQTQRYNLVFDLIHRIRIYLRQIYKH